MKRGNDTVGKFAINHIGTIAAHITVLCEVIRDDYNEFGDEWWPRIVWDGTYLEMHLQHDSDSSEKFEWHSSGWTPYHDPIFVHGSGADHLNGMHHAVRHGNVNFFLKNWTLAIAEFLSLKEVPPEMIEDLRQIAEDIK